MTLLHAITDSAKRQNAPRSILRRTLDPANLNSVANHPDVRPWLGGKGPLDLSEVISHPANFALEVDGGGYVLVNQGGGQYEAHTLFLPDARALAYPAAVEGFRYLFAATDCQRVVTKVPEGNPAAAAHAKRCGFVPWFDRAAAWSGANGPERVSYQVLTLEAWAMRDPVARQQGEWFHDELERVKIAAGSVREIHDDDEAHDQAVGATVLMFRAGNAAKAAHFYNGWAALAGFAPLTVLSLTPLVVDVVDALVEVTQEGMEVLRCR